MVQAERESCVSDVEAGIPFSTSVPPFLTAMPMWFYEHGQLGWGGVGCRRGLRE